MVAKTSDRFPTYAELAQTLGWAGAPPAPIAPTTIEQETAPGSRYTEQAVLGVGGMGKVVLARDARIGREVAVKQLRSDRELTPEERSRFLREAQVQGQLEHPSIVPVYDVDHRPDGTTFFTMRRVLGRTLHDILDDLRRGVPEAVARHTQRELLQGFATVCLAVDYAHSRGVIHRDLKPANIMLGDFGEVYVLDWGIARLIEQDSRAAGDERLSMPGSPMGTPLYMAPEQMFDPDVTTAADVFSLGAVLFEILTLERLRTSRDALMCEARPSVRAPDRGVALELELLCVDATQHDPAERLDSARTLQEAIARHLEGDRDLARRRELAARHAASAREAMDRAAAPGADHDREIGHALRELTQALALEPANPEHVAMFAEIMAAPARTTPPAIRAQIEEDHQGVISAGTRYAGFAMLSWLLFIPPILALGLRRLDFLFLIVALVAATVATSFLASWQRRTGRLIQCAVIGLMMLSGCAVSRMFGPVILMPTVITAWVIVMQINPVPSVRRFALVVSPIAMLAPIVLELAGVVPSSYLFENGRMILVPQLTELPQLLTFGFLGIANVGAALVPALFVGRLRAELTRTQERELVQAWTFRRLPIELMRAGAR
jgi:serine/threonine-protein kinase